MTGNIVLGKVEVVEKTVEVDKKKKCGICFEEYNSTNVVEAVLKTCGHCACRKCLYKIWEEAEQQAWRNRRWTPNARVTAVKAKCPTCQKEFGYTQILKIFH